MKKRIAFFVTTFLLLTVTFFCFSTTAYSQSVEKAAVAEKELMDIEEKEFLHTVKQVMKEHGCAYSGVTMTKTYGEDGSRIYRVAVHHRNLSYLSEAETEALREQLAEKLEEQFVTQPYYESRNWEHVEFYFEFTYSS